MSKISSDNESDRKTILNTACTALMEHFDAVQILTTWADHTQTYDLAWGQGNWYARQGLVQTFIQRDKAQENAVELAAKINDNRDCDGEDWKVE